MCKIVFCGSWTILIRRNSSLRFPAGLEILRSPRIYRLALPFSCSSAGSSHPKLIKEPRNSKKKKLNVHLELNDPHIISNVFLIYLKKNSCLNLRHINSQGHLAWYNLIKIVDALYFCVITYKEVLASVIQRMPQTSFPVRKSGRKKMTSTSRCILIFIALESVFYKKKGLNCPKFMWNP